MFNSLPRKISRVLWRASLVFVGLAAALPTQAAGWISQNSGTTAALYDLDFKTDGNRGVIVGTDAISYSSNGGSTWTFRTANGATLFDASFVPNSETVWMVGAAGTVLKSLNGGETYGNQTTNAGVPTVSLYGVHAADSLTAWAVGTDGTIIRTNNGGATWPLQYSDATLILHGVSFVDASEGWAVGSGGKILHTANGGTTWTAQTSGVTEDLMSVHFVSSLAGFAVGNNRTILKTLNGGSTWTKLNTTLISATTGLEAVHALSVSFVIMTTDDGRVLNSIDGGAAWNVTTVSAGRLLGIKYVGSSNNRFTVGLTGSLYRYDGIAPVAPGTPARTPSGDPTNDSTPGFSWTAATDNETSIAAYDVRVDGGAWTGIGLATTYDVTPALAEGSHTFSVRARDAAGNLSAEADAAPFTIDLTAPVVGSPSPLTATQNAESSFVASASDSVAVSGCSFFVNGVSQGAMTVAGGTASRTYTFSTSGAFTVKVSCTDTAGNTGNSATVTVNVAASSIPPTDTTPTASASTVTASPSSVAADNSSSATVTVTVKNSGGTALSGKVVSLTSSRASADSIIALSSTTNASGAATFSVKSSAAGASTFTAVADGITLGSASVTFTAASTACPYVAGILVKLPNDGNPATQEDSAVYYYGSDCKRHAFPNDKVYFTWYGDFNAVSITSAQTLASMSLGKNVTYRPGVKMVKFQTVDKVYAVSKGGLLRWVKSEGVAVSLYGSAWNKKIDDISDAFYTNYSFGSDINNSGDYGPSAEMAAAPTIDDNL